MNRSTATALKHRPAVRTALRKVGIAGPALDDLTQRVFLISVERGVRAKAWLVETARKTAANYRGLHRHFREHIELDTVMGAPSRPHDDIELRVQLNRAFRVLSRADQELLVRHFVLGETLVELQPILGLKKSRIAVLVDDARRRFLEGFL